MSDEAMRRSRTRLFHAGLLRSQGKKAPAREIQRQAVRWSRLARELRRTGQ